MTARSPVAILTSSPLPLALEVEREPSGELPSPRALLGDAGTMGFVSAREMLGAAVEGGKAGEKGELVRPGTKGSSVQGGEVDRLGAQTGVAAVTDGGKTTAKKRRATPKAASKQTSRAQRKSAEVRKLSSTQVLDSDSPEPVQLEVVPAKKLSATQVLDSDDVESDNETVGENGLPCFHKGGSARKAAAAALDDWKAQVSERQEMRRRELEEKAARKIERQTRENRRQANHDDDCFDEKSGYFTFNARESPSKTATEMTGEGELSLEDADPREDSAIDLACEIAPQRRLDWTPVKDTTSHTTENPGENCDVTGSASRPTRNLTSLLADFNYHSNIFTQPQQRAEMGEATTKRRKIQLSEGPNARKASKDPSPKKVSKKERAPKEKKQGEQKPKAPPKKPQTITALATAAYQVHKEPTGELTKNETVSAFFSNSKSPNREDKAVNDTASAEKPAKKPRKPRARKVVTFDENGNRVHEVPKRQSKKMGKSALMERRQPLYPPDKACDQITRQDILFGTSSQLAVEESPTFLKQTLQALKESEMSPARAVNAAFQREMPGMSTFPTGTVDNRSPSKGKMSSKERVPSAPHGTSLSCGQADRELWCVAARDLEEGLLIESGFGSGSVDDLGDEDMPFIPTFEDVRKSGVVRMSQAPVGDLVQNAPDADDEIQPTHDHQQGESDLQLQEPQVLDHRPTIDLSHSSPPYVSRGGGLLGTAFHGCNQEAEQRSTILAPKPSRQDNVSPLEADKDEDNWMSLPSDSSVSFSLQPGRPNTLSTPQLRSPSPPHLLRTVKAMQLMPAAATVISPTRSVLQPLDANVSLMSMKVGCKPFGATARQFTTSATSPARKASSPSGRGRGRPRKADSTPTTAVSTPIKRKRGRPRKDDLAASPSNVLCSTKEDAGGSKAVNTTTRLSSDGFLDIDEVSEVEDERKKPKRSRKIADKLPSSPPSRLTKAVSVANRSPSRKRASQATTDFHDIDEISDSEAPATPSPPRRRATSSPPIVQPLTLSQPLPIASITTEISSELMNTPWLPLEADLKNITAANLSALQSYVFPCITKAVKGVPPSKDTRELSWHEKMLLFDPIVVEDLTDWLNGTAGLRVQCLRKKAVKKAKRGRKKKGMGGEKITDEEESTEDTEVVQEELKPWIVQKWCEANSICCFYKTGIGFNWGPRGRGH